jgi:hypothetical protein
LPSGLYFFDLADFREVADLRELEDFSVPVFFVPDFFDPDAFFDEDVLELVDFFFGTFFPFCRASESPIAIACLRLVTFLPLPPLFNVPRLRLRMAPSTSLEALGEYFRAIGLGSCQT